MKTTKFHELCNAYDKAQDNYNTYQKDGHIISMEIVREIKAYYRVPESQFSLYRISKERGVRARSFGLGLSEQFFIILNKYFDHLAQSDG